MTPTALSKYPILRYLTDPEIVPEPGRRVRAITIAETDLLVVLTAEEPVGRLCLVHDEAAAPILVQVLAEPRPGFYLLGDRTDTLVPAARLAGVVRVIIREFDHA